MAMREEVEAELETIRGIRIDKFAERDGTITAMTMTICVIEPSIPLPPFPEPESRVRGLLWYALFGLAFSALIYWVRA
jgi:hypothetical protein